MPKKCRADGTVNVEEAAITGLSVACVDESIVRIVTDFVENGKRTHAFIAGGLGTGKSRALGVAALAAGASGAQVAWLEQGSVGISSFDDFLAAVDEAVSGAAFRPAPLNADIQSPSVLTAVDDDVPLVVVMEGLDQLVRQLRANDRPALLTLLDDPRGPLIIGTAVLGALSEDFIERFAVLRTMQLPSPADGVRIALERASEQRVLEPSLGRELQISSAGIATAFSKNQMFWSLVGSHLAAGSGDSVRRAEADLRTIARSHFTGLLLRVAPSEQRVLLEIARAGAPRTVQEISEATNVRNQAAASALARLHAEGWVVSIPAPPGTDRRRTWYDIADPLLRLHLRPQGTGSIGDMIRSFLDAWQGPAVDSAAALDTDAVRARDTEAVCRGDAGEPHVARAWFESALLARAEVTGLRSNATLENYWTLAEWTGKSGDHQRAQRMLTAAMEDADASFGPSSRRALQARSRVGWNLLELGDFAQSHSLFEGVNSLAEQAGEHDLAALARQDLGRALGEQGAIADAVEHMRSAIAEMEQLSGADPSGESGSWAERIRRSRHGLAFWLARDGDPVQAVKILDDLLLDSQMSEHDRHSVELDRARIIGMSDRSEAIDDLHRLAARVEASGSDAGLARSARLASFDFAVDEWPREPARWSVRAVDPKNLEAVVTRLLATGKLDLQGLAQVLALASSGQVRTLAAGLVATPLALSSGQRSARARTLAPHLRRAVEQRLLADLAAALEGDPASEANLPEEWRDVVARMRVLDAAEAASPTASGITT